MFHGVDAFVSPFELCGLAKLRLIVGAEWARASVERMAAGSSEPNVASRSVLQSAADLFGLITQTGVLLLRRAGRGRSLVVLGATGFWAFSNHRSLSGR